jgi:phytoene synthase
MDDALNICAAHVRRADPDRYFTALFAPAERRPFLLALYAFNHEIARIGESVSEPMLGAIRLEWWRETVQSAMEGAPRNHDVARALAAGFADHPLPLDLFEALLTARAFDSAGEQFADLAALETYVDATSGNLMRLAARLLGADDSAVGAAGLAYGLTGLLRAVPFHASQRRLYLPLDLLKAAGLSPDDIFAGRGAAKLQAVMAQIAARARVHYGRAHKGPKMRTGLAAVLPASLVPLYLRRLRYEIPIHRKQISMLAAAMRGRV